jgi:hypothetical protein
MLDGERTDAIASTGLGDSGLKERFVSFAKIGFWVFTALLALQIFLKAVYFAHL